MGVRFAAIPMGHEFTSLVLALLQAGGHPPKLERRSDRADPGARGRLRLRDVHVAHLPQLPRRRAGAEPDGGAQSAHPPRRDRRRAVPGRGRGAPGHGGAGDLPERPAVRLGPDGDRRDPREDRHRRRGARRREARRARTCSTCWSSAAARRARRPRCTRRARASAPASSPSASAARRSTRSASRTSSRCSRPRDPSSPPRWKRTRAATTSTSSAASASQRCSPRPRRAAPRR